MKKTFKTIVILLIVSAFFLAICMATFAVSGMYDIDDLELQVTIPSDYSVITRDTPASDPIFNRLGTTKSAIMSMFEASSIYLNALSETHNEEVVVTMTEINENDLNSYSDSALTILAASLVSEYSKYGFNISKYDVYQHSQTKFIRLYFTDTAKTVHGLQYYTVYNSKAMNFTMRSYEGKLDSRQETAIKTIVDSIQFHKTTSSSNPGTDTKSFTHTDSESGVTFTVPANWNREGFTQDREYIDAKFVSTKEDGVIIFGSTDVWAKMSASDKVGYNRSDLNNSVFTRSDIAAMYNTTADKISTITYNGVQYFKGEINYSTNVNGVNVSVTMTQLVYIDNGWMYMFQFGGTSTHKLYSDFEALLKSVKYPTASDVGDAGSSNNPNVENNNTNNDSESYYGIIIIAVLAVIAVIVIYRKNNTPPTNSANPYGDL
ncbi:MAG: hypothetical protein E7648_03605 [Ruminococcaceae bacterium]|nr:hypothetical protein [Oscillospiraceae bacterium]